MVYGEQERKRIRLRIFPTISLASHFLSYFLDCFTLLVCPFMFLIRKVFRGVMRSLGSGGWKAAYKLSGISQR
jgi:hypothetical protein